MSNEVRLHHGDFRKVLDHIKADLIFTSPPYNIGSKSKKIVGRRKYGKFDRKSFGSITDYADNLPEAKYQKQQIDFLEWAAGHLRPNGVLVYNHKPRRNGHMIHPLEWISKVSDLTLMEEIIWDRGSTHNHCPQMIWPHTERLYVMKKSGGKYSFRNSSSLGFRSDVWKIPKAATNGHNAPFPLMLAEAVIKAWSKPNDLVCDPYSGSGTVACACKSLGRRFEGAEILKKYVTLALNELNHAHI